MRILKKLYPILIKIFTSVVFIFSAYSQVVCTPGEECFPDPDYTPQEPTCEVVATYGNNAGDCYVYRPHTGWVYKSCDQDPLCTGEDEAETGTVGGKGKKKKKEKSGSEDDQFWNDPEWKAMERRWEAKRIGIQTTHNLKVILNNQFDLLTEWSENVPDSLYDINDWLEDGKEMFHEVRNIVSEQSSAVAPYMALHILEEKARNIMYLYEKIFYRIYLEGVSNKIGMDIQRELKNFWSKTPITDSDWFNKADLIIQKIESRIRNIVQNPDVKPYYPNTAKEFITEEDIQTWIQRHEVSAQDELAYLMDQHILKQTEQTVRKNLDSLNQTIEDTLSEEYSNLDFLYDTSDDPAKSLPFDFLYKNEITEPANNALKSKYSRRELAFLRENPFKYIPLDPETYSRIVPATVPILENKELVEPDEEPYIFLSPEGEFLEKNKKLYEKLRKTSPWHEQGISAKEIGLSAVEVADEEFSKGNETEAETAFQIGEAMADIAIGIIPYVGTGKDAYELFTGKHLLTGRTLSLFERSMSGLGIALSAISYGTLSSGAIKFSLQKTENVLRKINAKLIDKTLKGLSETQLLKVIKEYPEAFFRSVDAISLKTQADVQSALKFLKRAFARENPSVEQFEQVIKKVGKKGIENYTKALDELKNFDPKIFEFGKEFLARQVLLSKEIFQQTGVKISQKSLVQMGQYYARISRALSSIQFPSLDKIKSIAKRPEGKIAVWRTIRALYPEEGAFKFHTGMKSYIARYTIGEEGVYTALSKKTSQGDLPKDIKNEIEIFDFYK